MRPRAPRRRHSNQDQPFLLPLVRSSRAGEAARGRAGLAAREKAALWARLEVDARRIAEAFGFSYKVIEPEREGVKRHYGITYRDGTIRIRLRHSKTGRPLKYSSLVNTVCHELAHLEHFNHGEGFKRCYLRLLRWAREQGIYRPGPDQPSEPVQLGLFWPGSLTRTVLKGKGPGPSI